MLGSLDMYSTPEIASMTPAPSEKGRMFFSLWYLHKQYDVDGSFKKVAREQGRQDRWPRVRVSQR